MESQQLMFGCSKKNQANTKEELRREKRHELLRQVKNGQKWKQNHLEWSERVTLLLMLPTFYLSFHFIILYSLQAKPQKLTDHIGYSTPPPPTSRVFTITFAADMVNTYPKGLPYVLCIQLAPLNYQVPYYMIVL